MCEPYNFSKREIRLFTESAGNRIVEVDSEEKQRLEIVKNCTVFSSMSSHVILIVS